MSDRFYVRTAELRRGLWWASNRLSLLLVRISGERPFLKTSIVLSDDSRFKRGEPAPDGTVYIRECVMPSERDRDAAVEASRLEQRPPYTMR